MTRIFLAGCWQARSFIAGTLIGLSIVVPVFASIGASTTDWQAWLVYGAPIILAVGIVLQAIVIADLREPRTIDKGSRWKREAPHVAA
jgi:hypothetical protein